MEIKDLKQAETILIETTQNEDVLYTIEEEVEKWELQDFNDSQDVSLIEELLHRLTNELFGENENEIISDAVQWVVFDRIHDSLFASISTTFISEDARFFEKCKILCDLNVSAEQFGADENYTIPLSAAIVELSILDSYRSPTEKMNCLCSTYDLVFAELKTAMVSVISQTSEKENDIPIIDNRDVIPILMVMIIRSKLVHMFSNLFYIKSFYNGLDSKHVMFEILMSFEKAINKVLKINLSELQPPASKVLKTIDLEEYIKITSSDAAPTNKTLVDEANQRVLNLITRSTTEDQALC